MGLDGVELVISIEERFGIDIPDEDAAKITTPRKLIDYVCAHVRTVDDGKCVSQRSFYRVRRMLAAATGAHRRDIRPTTPLDSLLPMPGRKILWPTLAHSLGVRTRLGRPVWLTWALVVAAGLVFAATVVVAREHRLVVATLATAAFATITATLTRPAAVYLNSTVGNLASMAIPKLIEEDRVQQRATSWTRGEVAEMVRQMIRDQLGVKTFSDDADFIKDLGMD